MSTPLRSPATRGRPQRSTTNRMVAGVCGGLAEYARIDPLLVRVVFAVLTVFGGLGVICYGVCWLLLPREDEPLSIGEAALRTGRDGGTVFTALALVAVVAITASIAWDGRFSNLGLLLVVLAAAAFFYRRHEHEHQTGSAVPRQPSRPAPESQRPADLGTLSMAAVDREAERIAAARMAEEELSLFPPPKPEPEPAPKRPFSPVTPVVLSLLVILAAGAIAAGDWLTVRQYLAVALGIVGAGVVVSTWYGRAGGLIALGIPLTAVLLISSMVPFTSGAPYGQRTWRPAHVAAIQRHYTLNGGNLDLDLSTVDFGGTSRQTTVELGVGQAEITVPQDVDVTVHGDLSGGEFRMPAYERNGQGLHLEHTDLGPDGKGGGTLDVKADIGFGQLVVRRAAA